MKSYLFITTSLSIEETGCLYFEVCFWSSWVIPLSKKSEVSTNILKCSENRSGWFQSCR